MDGFVVGELFFTAMLLIALGPPWPTRRMERPRVETTATRLVIGESAVLLLAIVLDLSIGALAIGLLVHPITPEVVAAAVFAVAIAALLAVISPTPANRINPYLGAMLGAITQEYVFRGYFFLLLRAVTTSSAASIALVTLCFALFHRRNGRGTVLRAAALSVTFCVAVLVSSSLLPAIAGHAAGGLILARRAAGNAAMTVRASHTT
jgi:hypothetical protein